MGKFEEQLLGDLIREHGPDLASAKRPRARRTKPVWVAAGVGLTGAVAAAFLLVPGENPVENPGEGPQAQNPVAAPDPQPQPQEAPRRPYKVSENSDGTVSIAVDNASDVEELTKYMANKDVRTPAGKDIEVRCIQVGGMNEPMNKSVPMTIEELARKLGSTPAKLIDGSNGRIALYAAKCD